MQLFQDIKAVIRSPNAFFEQQAKEPEMKRAIAVIAFTVFVSSCVDFITTAVHPIDALIIAIITLFIDIFILGIWSGAVHLSANVCGGDGQYKSAYICFLFLQPLELILVAVWGLKFLVDDPVQLSERMLATIGLVIMVVILYFLVWIIYLSIIIVKKCYGLSNRQAVLSLIIPFSVIIFLFVNK